ncbi:MAG: chloride channel protein [Candidatus Woesearchaeota archaeon]
MPRQISEQTVLLVSILKWVVLATFIGAIVGLTTTAFLKLLNISIVTFRLNPYFLFAIPLVFVLNSLISRYLWPDDDVDTTDKVIHCVHESKPISWRSGIKAFFLPILTIAGGGSAGKEAPCADVGAASGSMFANLLKLNREDRKKFIICGVSAGFAAVFGTPIAGAIFGVEVLFVGGILYEVLLPSFIAGVTAFYVSSSLGITYFSYKLDFVPIISEAFLIKVILAGLFFGAISYLIVESFKRTKKYSELLKIWPPIKALIAGILIALIALLFSTRYLGLGLDTIESTLQGTQIIWFALILKLVVTILTLNFGGSGGVITPVLFMGTVSGAIFASLFHLDISTFAAIGLVAVLAGVANTPIAASIMAIELFGPEIGVYAAVACVISFLMSGYRSLFPSQILSISKSSSLHVDKGSKISETKVKFKAKPHGAMKYVIKTVDESVKLQNKLKRQKKKFRNELLEK